MQRFLIIFAITFFSSYLRGQDIVNGDFSSFCGTQPTVSCSACTGGSSFQYFNSPCLNNWFRSNGAPYISAPYLILRTVDYPYPNSCTACDGPGSQGIVGNYNFVAGETYTISLLMKVYNACHYTSISLFATNGLTEPPTPTCAFSPLTIPAGNEPIGSYSPSLWGEVHTDWTLTFTFTATLAGNNQLLILVDQSSQLYPYCGDKGSVYGLYIKLAQVSIFHCTRDILLINKSTTIDPSTGVLFSSGGTFAHSAIRAGSSVAPSGDPIVNSPTNIKTTLIGEWIQLEPNFKAVVNQGSFFEAIPNIHCGNPLPCSIKGPDCIVPGGSITLVPGTLGGTWTSSSLDVTVSAGGVVVANPFVPLGTIVTITYSYRECITTLDIVVGADCGPTERISAHRNVISKEENSSVQPIKIMPNPAENYISIFYPCKSDGQLEIKIKDIAGRVRYSELVNCNRGNDVQHEIDISTLVSGIYIVDLTLNNQHYIKKVVKM